jgi:hypothetical protein
LCTFLCHLRLQLAVLCKWHHQLRRAYNTPVITSFYRDESCEPYAMLTIG